MPPQERSRPLWYVRRRRDAVASDVDEELSPHLDMRIADLMAHGLSRQAARRAALDQFGDLERTRKYCRQQDHNKEKRMARGLMLGDLAQDIRICIRSLLRAPLMTMTIVVTVGLGIGATTLIFSAVNAALLRPLPYADPSRLVRIYTDAPPYRFRFSAADYLALDAQQTQFEQIAAYTDRAMSFSDGQVAERVRGRLVSWTYFSLLGIAPAMGPGFTEGNGRQGSPPALMVSHGFWQRRLGGRAGVIGQAIRLDGADYTLVGVLPERVGPLEQGQEFFVAAQWQTPPRRGPFLYTVLARLRADADPAAAAGELRAINRRIFPIWQSSYQDDKATWSMVGLKEHIVGDVETIAGLALAAVGLVWLIACTNASNLLIARVTSRRRELAVRSALGASRGRVVRHLLAESCVLASAAAVVGGLLAWFGIPLIREFGSGYFPRTDEIALHGAVRWLLIGVTAASALLFGIIPAAHGSGAAVDETLRAAGRSTTGSPAVRRVRRVLVGSQFAIATPLLVVAGLLLASLSELRNVDLGFDSRNMLTGSIQLPAASYQEPGRAASFWEEFKRRVEVLPGVTAVAFADGRPPNDVGNFNNFDLEDFPTPAGQSQPVAPWVAVTPDYFRVLGLTLVDGRLLEERDGPTEGVAAVVVDRAWARRFFPNSRAVGKRFRAGGCTTCEWTTVVGVVSEVKYAGLDQPDDGTVYQPMPPGARTRNVVLRTATEPRILAPLVEQVLRGLDATVPLSSVFTIDELVARSLQRPRLLSLLVGAFAIVALLLAIIGIYGVMSYYVEQHSRDISIRMALGGSASEVLRLIVGQAMTVVAGGVALGLLGAIGATRLMTSLLFGVSAGDLFTFVAVAALLLMVALVACLLPARRAIGLQPAAVLRND